MLTRPLPQFHPEPLPLLWENDIEGYFTHQPLTETEPVKVEPQPPLDQMYAYFCAA